MKSLRAVAAVLVAVCVAACTSTPELPPVAGDWPARRAQLEQLDHWQLSGKLAVKTQSGADSARISWQQVGTQTYLTLSGPGGWGRATVIANKDSLLLERDGQQQHLNLADAAEVDVNWAGTCPQRCCPIG